MSKVLVGFIQDRSGSMQSVWDETLNGFKTFLQELRESGKQDGVEYLFSLTTFDTQVETPISSEPIDQVSDTTLEKHGPRGGTALYDAVGATIKNIEDKRNGADKVVVVIVTDGHENSSREWSKDKLQKAVEAKLAAGDWTFTYLGTQPETWDDAAAFGLSAGATVSYTPTMAGQAYGATAQSVRSLSMSSAKGTRNLMKEHLSGAAAAKAGIRKHHREQKQPAAKPPKVEPPQQSQSDETARWR